MDLSDIREDTGNDAVLLTEERDGATFYALLFENGYQTQWFADMHTAFMAGADYLTVLGVI